MRLMWRRVLEISVGSALFFVALPFGVRAVGGNFTDGVLMGTGIAIVWYTLETLDLRRETSKLREEAERQNVTASAQKKIALEQADRAIRPLLVTRIEDVRPPGSPLPAEKCVLRNIGHGPALFIEVQAFKVNVWTKGDWLVEVGPVDLVEPGKFAELLLMPQGEGQKPNSVEIVNSLREAPGRATGNYEVVIYYEDVQKRQFTSVMQMGMDGTKLVDHRAI